MFIQNFVSKVLLLIEVQKKNILMRQAVDSN